MTLVDTAAVIHPYLCEHHRTEIRWRILRNGVGIYALQCLDCGHMIRQIAKKSPEVLRITEKIPFDEGLADIYLEQFRANTQHAMDIACENARIENEKQQREWWDWYNSYLKTPQWQRKRRAVIDRCGGICEGCRINKVFQIHHLTYDHAGDEFLWELVGVCRMCHSRLHTHLGEDV